MVYFEECGTAVRLDKSHPIVIWLAIGLAHCLLFLRYIVCAFPSGGRFKEHLHIFVAIHAIATVFNRPDVPTIEPTELKKYRASGAKLGYRVGVDTRKAHQDGEQLFFAKPNLDCKIWLHKMRRDNKME